jgi:hypothetical protein
MSNSQWHNDQTIGDLVSQKWRTESEAINKIAAERDEYRELLSAFIDATVLKGFTITRAQWERACLLCGRWTPPFVEKAEGEE